jgi:transposase
MARESGITLSVNERRVLRKFLEHDTQGASALRVAAVLISGAGLSSEKIGRTLGITAREVRKCRQRWRDGGLSGLLDQPLPGRPSQATSTYTRLLVRTAKRDPRKMGYAFSRWTTPRLSTYLFKKTGIRLTPDYVRKLLLARDLVWGKSKLTTANLANPVEKKISREMAKLAANGLRIVGIHF